MRMRMRIRTRIRMRIRIRIREKKRKDCVCVCVFAFVQMSPKSTDDKRQMSAPVGFIVSRRLKLENDLKF